MPEPRRYTYASVTLPSDWWWGVQSSCCEHRIIDRSYFWVTRYLLILLFALPAQAQSVDSLWGFRQVRHFTEAHQKTILIPLAAGTIAAQGLVHASFYASRHGNDFIDIHGASEILGALHFSTSYVAGLDPVEAFGATMVGMFAFQGFVNTGSGLPFVNPDEARRYEAFGGDWTWRRMFVGYGRWLQLGIGIILIAYRPIVRALW